MFLEMKVTGSALDPFTNTPIVILKDSTGKKILPIWVGYAEASSIAMELEKTPRARPQGAARRGRRNRRTQVAAPLPRIARFGETTQIFLFLRT